MYLCFIIEIAVQTYRKQCCSHDDDVRCLKIVLIFTKSGWTSSCRGNIAVSCFCNVKILQIRKGHVKRLIKQMCCVCNYIYLFEKYYIWRRIADMICIKPSKQSRIRIIRRIRSIIGQGRKLKDGLLKIVTQRVQCTDLHVCFLIFTREFQQQQQRVFEQHWSESIKTAPEDIYLDSKLIC